MWQVVLSETAVRQFRQIEKGRRAILKDGIRKNLAESDTTQRSRNKFRLRRASEHAEYELRLEPWRVFYRVRGSLVEVAILGKQRVNLLLISEEEFVL